MDVRVGQRAGRELAVTEEIVAAYAKITCDYNPLHFDKEFAARTRFGRLIAQGGITTGLLNALGAMDMPGPGTVFVTQQWRFPRPFYIGDVIRAEAVVKSLDAERGTARIEFVVTNQADVEVLRGTGSVFQARLLR